MIRLTCSACRTILDVDDAFAGGVCRCSHCGTIQTVPSIPSAGDQPAASPDPNAPPQDPTHVPQGKTLLRQQGRAVVGSGLDELAQIVASSGLRSSRLRSAKPPIADYARQDPRQDKTSRFLRITLLGVAALGLLLLASLFFSLRSSSVTGRAPVSAVQVAPQNNPNASTAATLLDPIPLSTPKSIVFLVDRGGSSSEVFSYLKELCLRAAASLGPTRQFAVIFWTNGTPEISYPRSDTLAFAAPESLAAARKTLDDVTAFGQSDITKSLRSALALKPDAIVILTAKGFDLDDAWADNVLSTRNSMSPSTLIHTLSIGTSGLSPGLKKLADRAGGTYAELSAAEVRNRASD